jgi:hypothetical protein
MSIVSDERVEELLKNEKEKDAEIERLKALLVRAADALAYWNDLPESRGKFLELIAELRKRPHEPGVSG